MRHPPQLNYPEHLNFLTGATPARLCVRHVGLRPLTASWLKFRQDHAQARDAVKSELGEDFLNGFVAARGLPVIASRAIDRRDFILCPPNGKRAHDHVIEALCSSCPGGVDLQVVIADGLSSAAVEANLPDLLPILDQGLKMEGIIAGQPVVVRNGRVAIGDQIAHALNARLSLVLIGERPGLSCARALSAYLTLNPGPKTISSDRTVVSNIHPQGTPAVEAGALIVRLARRILNEGASGVRLQQLL